jgi:glycosyltransferase involved in cell wall biosynthesis
MKICLIEPFHTGSHAAWAKEYAHYSRHQVELLTLSGRHWKWRMHGGAVTLAKMFLEGSFDPDILLATDMLDLTTFLALSREKSAGRPTAVYFHENQLTYPWSPTDTDTKQRRDAHYAFINYTTALAADAILFNSQHHQQSFLAQLPDFLKSFPDHNELGTLQELKQRSSTSPLGLDLKKFDDFQPTAPESKQGIPLVLWNHRWEYDKNPEAFFSALYILQDEGYDFNVAILGESYRKYPPVFDEARNRLGSRVLHFGYVENFSDYADWLWKADILPVTSNHDFFGASVVQAIYCGCTPLLPRRLAYPEHLPKEMHDHNLYDSVEELLEKLRCRLTTADQNKNTRIKHVSAYDWSVLARSYDELFERLL